MSLMYNDRLESHIALVKSTCNRGEVSDFLYSLRVRGTGAITLPNDVAVRCISELKHQSRAPHKVTLDLVGRSSPGNASRGSVIGFSLLRERYGDLITYCRETPTFYDSMCEQTARFQDLLDLGGYVREPVKTTKTWFSAMIPSPHLPPKEYDITISLLKRLVMNLKSRGQKLKGLSDADRDRVVNRIITETNQVMRDICPEQWRNGAAISDIRRDLPSHNANLLLAICIKNGMTSHADLFKLLPVVNRIIFDSLADVDLSDWEVLKDIDVIMHLFPIEQRA